ncbi:MAG: hypothetical protein KF699_03420 [Phycisphaeraceae bacterium]|nr:hypothetical protein [Phycisphaeraceae bacterium]MBX3405560.1 hypothetical protein [Phycisphaeraceae bacterium]
MKLWLVPIAVFALVGFIAATFMLLDPGAAFVVFAVVVVCGLGAAPVVFAWRTRHQQRAQRPPNGRRTSD